MDIYIVYVKKNIPRNEMIYFLANHLNIDACKIGFVTDRQPSNIVVIEKMEYEYGYRCTFEAYMSMETMSQFELLKEFEFAKLISKYFDTNVLVSDDSPGHSWILIRPDGTNQKVYETNESLDDDWEGGLEVYE